MTTKNVIRPGRYATVALYDMDSNQFLAKLEDELVESYDVKVELFIAGVGNVRITRIDWRWNSRLGDVAVWVRAASYKG